MKPEELEKLAEAVTLRVEAVNCAFDNSEYPNWDHARADIKQAALTALQQAVDVQREEDARLCERLFAHWNEAMRDADHSYISGIEACAECIRAGKQTVQEESEGV